MNLCVKSESEWKNIAKEVAAQISVFSIEVDEQGTFPEQSIQLLRASGLMGISIPSRYGGAELSLETIKEIGKIISGACLSTGMIWAMHMQQVMIITAYAQESLKERLMPRIVAGELYIVSVTSDQGGAGGQISTTFVINQDGDHVVIERHAPIVTGAAHGDVYLIIMKADEHKSGLMFVVAERNQINVEVTQKWKSMGMRGTRSCEVYIKGQVPMDQVVSSQSYDVICNETMNPIGHLLWASCWLGAVQAEYRKLMKLIRSPKYRNKYKMDSDLLAHNIGRIRLKLDTMESNIDYFCGYYQSYIASNSGYTNTYKIKVNNLKLLVSETTSEVMDLLLQLGGVKYGYLVNDETSIEKVYRDIRSSRIMIGNEHLQVINGKLSMLERL